MRAARFCINLIIMSRLFVCLLCIRKHHSFRHSSDRRSRIRPPRANEDHKFGAIFALNKHFGFVFIKVSP